MKIKICGITSLQDARVALDLGAWALGFIFYKKSPRYIEFEKASNIISKLPADANCVAVVVDELESNLNRIVDLGIRRFQFHGSEPASFCRHFGVPYWKAFSALKWWNLEGGEEASVARSAMQIFMKEELDQYPDAEAVLIDSGTADRPGGTGRLLPKEVLFQLRGQHERMILAGGLNAENVRSVVELIKPFAVDVSSGVEKSPGVKSPEKMRDFFNALKGV